MEISQKLEKDRSYCIGCHGELPEDAAFCMYCGRYQKSEIVEARLAVLRNSYRTTMRWLMLVFGIVCMASFVSMALSAGNQPWGDLFFWTAIVVILVSFVVIPQVLWRDRSGAVEVRSWLPMLASLSVGASFGLLLWWGGRMASTLTMTMGGVSILADISAVVMVLGNAALSLGLAYSVDGLDKQKMALERIRIILFTLIGIQVLLNIVAELLWRAYY